MATLTLSSADLASWLACLLKVENATKQGAVWATNLTNSQSFQAGLWISLKTLYSGLADGDSIDARTGTVAGKSITLSSNDLTSWLRASMSILGAQTQITQWAAKLVNSQSAQAIKWAALKAAYPGLTDSNSIDVATGNVI